MEMKDKHIFSESYENRKQVLLNALNREAAIAENKETRPAFRRISVKILVSAVVLSVLAVSVYAALQLIEFRMEREGDEVYVYAKLNESTQNNSDKAEKPLRSWRAENGEISVSLNIPDLPSDMSEDQTANGKYGSDDNSRSMTVNGIDLRRSDLNQLIGGATSTKQLNVRGKTMYVIERSEADYYNRIAYIVFDEDELVLKLWVSWGITDDELSALASTMTLKYTTDALLAIPIQNEVSDTSKIDIPFVYVKEDEPIYEDELIAIGDSARDDNDWYTLTVNDVSVYDNISVLDPDCILREDFVNRFIDDEGKFIPYNRTEVVWIEWEDKEPTKTFREDISATKELYVVTLTVVDVTMDDINEADRDRMLTACVNSYNLSGYTVKNGKLDMIDINAVVDRQPGENACSSEIVYREYIGNCQWRVAYLIDEDIAEGSLVLKNYTSGIAVKLR